MSGIVTVGLDLAEAVFVAFGASSIRVHGADGAGRSVLRKKLRRMQVLEFFGQITTALPHASRQGFLS